MIKAHEIQGVLALENSFNRVGLDHVLLVRVASTAVATRMLGGTRSRIINALSNAWTDGGALRTYRHAPNTGSRKSWAAGDATARGVRHALMAMQGEMGYPVGALGQDMGLLRRAVSRASPSQLARPFGSYVMEHVLFKISFPAEFHAQTAVEGASNCIRRVKNRLNEIDESRHHHPRIGDPHHRQDRPAAQSRRPRSLPAIHDRHRPDFRRAHRGSLRRRSRRRSAHRRAARQDGLRENPRYTRDYLDPDKRSIANAVQVFFKDGSSTENVEVEYPIGHRRRRAEGMPLLMKKFEANLASRFAPLSARRFYVFARYRDARRDRGR